jgi:hypothetical protein
MLCHIAAIWPRDIPTYRDVQMCVDARMDHATRCMLMIACGLRSCKHHDCTPAIGLCTRVTEIMCTYGSFKQLEWMHRVCRILPTQREFLLAMGNKNIGAMEWIYCAGTYLSHPQTNDDSVYNWCQLHNLNPSRDEYLTADEIIKSMQHDHSLRYRMMMGWGVPDDVTRWMCEQVCNDMPGYKSLSLNSHGVEVAYAAGYFPKLAQHSITYLGVITPAVAKAIYSVRPNYGIKWWLDIITATDETYEEMSAFLNEVALNDDPRKCDLMTYHMSRWAIRWVVENRIPCNHNTSQIPTTCFVQNIDYLASQIDIRYMLYRDNTPVLMALIDRIELTREHRLSIAKYASGKVLQKLGIHGKSYLVMALKYNNVLGLDYLYACACALTPHKYTWRWFMLHADAENYEWIRRSVPMPKYAVHVFRRFDAQLLALLRADGVTTFVHTSTKMSESDAMWMLRKM